MTFVLLALLNVGSAWGSVELFETDQAEMELRADLYHLGLLGEKGPIDDACIGRDIAGCALYVAGSFSTTEDRIAAARACRGNFGKTCAEYVAGTFNDRPLRMAAAEACAGNFLNACAEYVAGRTSSTAAERIEAAQACRLADVGCVSQVAGSNPSRAQRIAAAQACGSQ